MIDLLNLRSYSIVRVRSFDASRLFCASLSALRTRYSPGERRRSRMIVLRWTPS
jgi:hypothetical protein